MSAYFQALDMWSDEEFLCRFGDAIDDRVAEILDELLEERDVERRYRRLRQVLGMVSLVPVLIASMLQWHGTIAA